MAAGPEGTVLLLGWRSYIARAIQATDTRSRVRAVPHDALDRADLLDGIEAVIACARHPAIMRDDYDLDRDDPDIRLARRIGDRPLRYLMLSTRKVYAPAGRPLDESAPIGPADAYGRNKLRVEQRLRDRLDERLVVLRLGNIFGFELEPGRRTFLGLLLRSLAETGQIRFDMSPFVERDFLPVERTAEILLELTEPTLEPPPVLNVGSGMGLACGRLALWILEGYGRGELVITRPEERDAFVLEAGRLERLLGPIIDRAALRAACLALGRRLAAS